MKKLQMTRKRWIIFGIVLGGVCAVTIIVTLTFNWLSCHVVETPHSRLEGPVKQEWVAHNRLEASPRAIAVDQQGNIYVTGYGYTNYSSGCITIKYSSQGRELWASQQYPDLLSTAIAVDTYSNVFVIGTRCCNNSQNELVTLKYDANGNELWVASHNLNVSPYLYGQNAAIALDNQGNAYVMVASGDTPHTIKYNSNTGSELWVALNESLGGTQEYPSIAIDDSGNVYVGGTTSIMKYDSDGNELWCISHEMESGWDNTVGNGDLGDVLALDPQGNVCVAIGNHRVTKYDTNGNTIWVSRYNSPPKGYGRPRSVAVDELGNIFVMGSLATVKYTGDGKLLWAGDGGEDIAVDNMGNAYVTGEDGKWCITTKYNADGAKVWAARYWGGVGEGDLPYGIALDASSNVYITGKSIYKICPHPFNVFDPEDTYVEWVTIKYSQQ